jgi:predicted MFS family arabinose efflux permease
MHGNMLILICAIALINSEQNLLAPNLSAVAASFNFTAAEKDLAAGGLALSLFLVGAPAALLIGAAADGAATRRVDLLVLVLLLGTAGCIGSACAWTYAQLCVARALTGVSLGGALPLTFSLLGDLAGPAQRTALSGRIGLAMTFGCAAGQGLAGVIGPALGWRSPFAVVSVLMLVIAGVVRLRMVEPRRPSSPPVRRTAEGSSTRSSSSSSYGNGNAGGGGGRGGGSSLGGGSRRLGSGLGGTNARRWLAIFRIRTVLLIMLQGVPGCVPWGAISAFLPDYLHADRGFSVREATLIMSSFSLGGAVGTTVGGELGQRLHNWRVSAPALLMLAAGIAGVVPLVALIASTPSGVPACCALALCGGSLATITGPNVRATLTNVTRADQRGLAFAAFALCDDVGKGAGPALLALGIARWGRRATLAAAMLCWIPCAALNGLTALTVRADGWHSLTHKDDKELEPLLLTDDDLFDLGGVRLS